MVSLIGYAMVRLNKHLPGEIYEEIMSYLTPKYLLNTPEISQYNKVMAAIPGFDIVSSDMERFGYVTTQDYTIRYIYRLKHNYKYTRRFIIVYLPFLPGVNHQEQYHIYHLLQDSPYQHETRTKRDLYKAKYGENS